jgi:hypothetical protein
MMTFEKTITGLVQEGKVDPAAGANFLGKKLNKMKEDAEKEGDRLNQERLAGGGAPRAVPKPAGPPKTGAAKPVIPKPAGPAKQAGGAAKPAGGSNKPPAPPPSGDTGGIRFDKEAEKPSSSGIGGFFKKKTGS